MATIERANGWTGPLTIDAHDDAVCSQCGAPMTGTKYVWRRRFSLRGDFWVEYAHPECIGGEGTKIVQELKL